MIADRASSQQQNPAAKRRSASHRLRRMGRWSVAAITGLNVLVLVGLWLRDGGVTGVHDVAGVLVSAGRITGLMGTYSLLIQVLLVARLRWVERLIGHDRLTAWHRNNGGVCLGLILGHVGLITTGYMLQDRISLWAEVKALLTLYPGMVTATIGTALLILVVVSSVVIVRRHLKYETWYVVHLLSYAAIVFAWFHQIPTGNEFILNSAAARYWIALYLITLALVVGFRLVAPVLFSFRFQLKVAEVIEEGPKVVSLRLTGRSLDTLRAHAGQFFLWRFLAPGFISESHPFSLSAAPDGQSLRITVKSLGDFSERVRAIPPGTRVLAEGPFGLFTHHVLRTEKVALIAGGIGITPIRALLEDMPSDVVVLYRVNYMSEIVFRDEFDALARERGVAIHYAAGLHTTAEGRRMLTPEHLLEVVPDLRDRDIYVCGPPPMTDAVTANLRKAGVSRKQIHVERFAFATTKAS